MGQDEDRGEPNPPAAPKIERRLRLYPLQAIGIPILALPAVLALFGVFGERRASVEAAGGALELRVDYPERYRYMTIDNLEILVRNVSAAAIDTLTVGIDSTYVSGFSQVTFVPGADEAYEVDLLGVEPGEWRRVHLELQGEDYGRHRGRVRATTGGADTVGVEISTRIFP